MNSREKRAKAGRSYFICAACGSEGGRRGVGGSGSEVGGLVVYGSKDV